MKIALAAAALLLTAPVLAACGSASECETVANDTSMGRPTAVPAASGPVSTAGLVTVMDTGTPEACLGPVAESFPPQCSGPELVGWDWADHDGVFEERGDVRWGQFAITGTWDGTRLTPTSAVAAALYDAMPAAEPSYPTPGKPLDDSALQEIRGELQDLPGAQGASVADGRVVVDVTYDDGSTQDWADATYGPGIVAVRSVLVDADE
jgi:hypothetical protein